MKEVLAVTVKEAADLLGIGRTKFYELLKSGEITSFQIGTRRLIPMSGLQSFIKQHEGTVDRSFAPNKTNEAAHEPSPPS
ncbi:MAG: helix-turn-helix domain-containing protein [Geminicoccaceae bacterium]